MDSGRIDWRERTSTTLTDLYDGDRHLLVSNLDVSAGIGRDAYREPQRRDVRIPHPLPGVRYADGIA